MQRQIQQIRVADFNLDITLESGQAFRWKRRTDGHWIGVIAGQQVRLRQEEDRIEIEAADLEIVARYFQWECDLRGIIGTFPRDAHLDAAVQACWGLRMLKQEPWECLASFMASSAKQIVQIRQIVENLSRALGDEILPCPPSGTGHAAPVHAFPSVETVANSRHDVLWRCKLGFRAKYLLASARAIVDGEVDLQSLGPMPCAEARETLCRLPGVGPKIANCVLLFAYGKPDAFPIDVWIERGLRQLYFPRKRAVTTGQLRTFSETYFGPHAGYAQQYLFHYLRTRSARRNRTGRSLKMLEQGFVPQ